MNKVMSILEAFSTDVAEYITTLSQQTLNIASIVVLHCVFVPSVIAYNSNITQTLPSLDSVLLVAFALSIMAVNSLVRRDMLAITTHLFGFVAQCVLLSFVIFK
jgi:hypothetical protein